MEEKILKILIEYSLEGKIADQSFLNQLADIIVIEWNLENYFKGFNLKETNNPQKFLHGEFDYTKRTADIYLAIDKLDLNKDKSEFIKKVYYLNVKIVQYLLKEIEHSKQLKIALSSRSDLKSNLIRENLEYFGFIKMPYKPVTLPDFLKRFMYDRFYEFMPIERMAKINSAKTTLNIISENVYPDINEEIVKELHKSKFSGYQIQGGKIVAPTPYFLDGINHNKSIKNMNFSIYDLETRLNLGLPIEYNEYYNNVEDCKKGL